MSGSLEYFGMIEAGIDPATGKLLKPEKRTVSMDDLTSEPVKPITPEEIQDRQVINKRFPAFVIGAFNDLLAERFDGREVTITFKEAEAAIRKVLPPKTKYESWWLNVEGLFRSAGWNVVVDNPAWNETYEGYYKFTLRPKDGR